MHLNPVYTTPAYTTSAIYDMFFVPLGLFFYYILSGIYDNFIFLTINERSISHSLWTNLSGLLKIRFRDGFKEYTHKNASVMNLENP